VQPDDPSDHDLAFYVVGSSDEDSLIIYNQLEQGRVYLNVPVRAIPWRDLNLINRMGRVRSSYGCDNLDDPMEKVKISVKGPDKIRSRTDIVGAENIIIENGIARILMGEKNNMIISSIRLTHGIRMPVRITVTNAKIKGDRRYVHIAQLSGGQLIGGVSLELKQLK
jgi:hypothetical protein